MRMDDNPDAQFQTGSKDGVLLLGGRLVRMDDNPDAQSDRPQGLLQFAVRTLDRKELKPFKTNLAAGNLLRSEQSVSVRTAAATPCCLATVPSG